jgi:hypothetical protein
MRSQHLVLVTALQSAPDARDAIMIIDDVLSIITQFFFQRALGAIIEVSYVYDGETLTWGDDWKFKNRVGFFSAIMMLAVRSAEWLY